MPTFLDLANTLHPGTTYEGRELASMRGKSFLSLLRGDRSAVHGEDEAIGWSSFALVKGEWKLVRQRSEDAEWELYHLAADPSETMDLADVRPDVFADLLLEWTRFTAETSLTP